MIYTVEPDEIPSRFRPAYEAVAGLARDERYVAALVFGSVARGEASAGSDFDAKIVVDGARSCGEINHPFVGGVKLDISFSTIEQLRQTTELGDRTRRAAADRRRVDRGVRQDRPAYGAAQ